MSPHPLVDCSLLLIDDEEANLDLLEGLLLADGYTRTARVADPRRAVEIFDACNPDLVLLDLHMPFLSGYEVLEQILQRTGEGEYLPVLVLTADITPEARDRALSHGARDFLTKPFDAGEVLLRVRNLLETRTLHRSQLEARVRAEAAERRARILADASRILSGSLDSGTGLAQITRYLVPRIAGGVAFVLHDPEGSRPVEGVGDGPLPGGLDPDREPLSGILEEGTTARVQTAAGEVVVTPMRSPRRSLGAMIVSPAEPAAEFTQADVDMLRDLGGRIALALENARLFADAQMASRARERMLSVVAHDLRNPLAVIGMYSEMLLGLMPGTEEGGDPYIGDALNSIHKSAYGMQEQIESLLDISRLQQGSFSVRPFPCGLRDFFAESDMLLRPLAVARGIELRIDAGPPTENDVIQVDAPRLQQVISNLVGNALKFTPQGGRVRVAWERDERELRVSVEDTGPGISADQLPHVFGAFWQAGSGDRRGLGLGLWIARAIVEGHGGRIWVDSPVGGGASFHFTIPADLESVLDSPPAEQGMGTLTHDPNPPLP